MPGPRAHVLSVVEDTWGRSTVYSTEPERDDELISAREPLRWDPQNEILSIPSKQLPDEEAPASREPSNEAYRLNRFEAALLATVLEDTIGQLRILDACNSELRARRTLFELDELTMVKFGVEAPTAAGDDDIERVDPARLRCDHYKLRKLDHDRAYLSGLAVSAYSELSQQESFARTRRELLALAEAEDQYDSHVADELRSRQRRRELARQLRQQRNHFKSQSYDADCATDALRTRVEDATLDGDIRARYVRRWQESRTEQHAWRLHSAESEPADAAEAFKLSADTEQRVHTEVEQLVAAEIDETMRKIEEWMEKYERDTEKVDLSTQIKKNDYQNALDRRLELEKTLKTHAERMEAWKLFKEEREKERKYREGMMKAAVCVQSWWRGLLVRRELGPYRPARKPKGKKPDKK